RVGLFRLVCGAIGVWRTGARQWGFYRLAGRGDDLPVKPCDRNFVAGLRDRASGRRMKLRVDIGEEFVGCRLRLNGWAVVDVVLDRYAFGEFSHAAEMVTMRMRGDEMV